MITVYSLCGKDGIHYSPHVWKVIMALHHKQLDFEIIPVDFSTIREIENGAFNSVPVLRDGDRVLGDSFEICEYLETAYPDAPSLFDGEGSRRMARFLESYCLTQLHPPLAVIAVMNMHNIMHESDQAYFRAKREERFGMSIEAMAEGGPEQRKILRERLAPLRAILNDHPWIYGDTPLLLDYVAFSALQWCWVVGVRDLLEEDDSVRAWFARCQDLFEGAARNPAPH